MFPPVSYALDDAHVDDLVLHHHVIVIQFLQFLSNRWFPFAGKGQDTHLVAFHAGGFYRRVPIVQTGKITNYLPDLICGCSDGDRFLHLLAGGTMGRRGSRQAN